MQIRLENITGNKTVQPKPPHHPENPENSEKDIHLLQAIMWYLAKDTKIANSARPNAISVITRLPRSWRLEFTLRRLPFAPMFEGSFEGIIFTQNSSN
jgi:hypothetical protein